MDMIKNIEVELRGLLSETEYSALIHRLDSEGVKRESDDKDTYFFNVKNGILKICDERSKNTAKISSKIGAEDFGALVERDIYFSRDQVPAALELFGALGYDKYHLVPQERTNYFLPSATLSLKFTPDFQYHFELEGELLDDPTLVDAEKSRLRAICSTYGIVPLEPEELTARIAEIRKRIGFDA